MAVTNLIDLNKIKQELVVFLRNSDIMTTSERGVTTDTDTGGWGGVTEHLINVSNIKNIRSITLTPPGSDLTFGTHYTVDYSYDDSGTIKCKILLSGSMAGTYSIIYDYGTDKIYPDFPRVDLKINSYPRIAVSVTSIRTDEMALGGKDTITDFLVSITVYANGMESVDEYVKAIREKFLEAKKSFFYITYITPITQSPLINEPARGNKIYQRTLELRSLFHVEEVS